MHPNTLVTITLFQTEDSLNALHYVLGKRHPASLCPWALVYWL